MFKTLQSAFRVLLRRRGRAALTVSGIAVGTFLVTLVSLIGQVGNTLAERELQNMGLRGLSVSAQGDWQLSEADLGAVRAAPGVSQAMPLIMAGGSGRLGNHTFSAYIGGIDAGAAQVISLEVLHGRLFHKGDVQAASAVCVVDETVALQAYGRRNVLGKTVRMTVGRSAVELTVVGVAKTGSSLLQSVTGYLAGFVYMPYTTLQQLNGQTEIDRIAVQVAADAEPAVVEQTLVSVLRRAHGVDTQPAVENLAQQQERLSALLKIVGGVLTAVSAVSLLVAGMGMMTSMVTAVRERVREIGIKQALGATRGRIWAEFLAESLILAAVGAAVGIGVGVLVGGVGMARLGVTVSWPWYTPVVIGAATVAMGGLFGWYPAHRAARLRPVEALRSEL